MKKYLLLFVCSFIGLQLFAGTIDVLGVNKQVDTLEYKSVGPGIMYAKLSFPEYPLSVYTLTVDLTNQYNLVETFQGGGQLGKTEAMTTAYTRLSSANHKTIAGVNGNFWVVSGQNQPTELLGVPYSGSSMNGEMITMPSSWNRGRGTTPEELLQEIGFATIDKNKRMLIDDMGFDGKVFIDGVGEFQISEINRIRKTDQIVFFNRFMGTLPTRSDDTGVEVFIKPVDGESWAVNDTVECEVVRIIADKGANTLQTGESVLSGTGTGRAFLENLSVGQRLKVNMGIYTLKDGVRPQVSEMVTGNALVMKDGALTIRNTNEAYNSQLYPRTGIGMSQDGQKLFLIVIDKSGTSIGANTSTMCGILKSSGAWNVTSMDGGGSAQIMLDGAIVNKPSDGQERAVSNGWFVYHNTPDDNVITRIEFEDYAVKVPLYASYKPKVLGYNQYGVLVNDDITDFSLTCDNALGHIEADKTFVASSNETAGTLTAHYNNIEVSKSINVIGAEIFFRLDSVLIDQRREYPIEVLSANGTNSMSIDPAALTWEVNNADICKIENGVLHGLSDGETYVVGTLGLIKDTLSVKVQTYDKQTRIQDNFSDTSGWLITSSASSWNTMFASSQLPTGWDHGSAINYTYQSARAPFIKIEKDFPFYSLPDSIQFTFNTSDIELSKIILGLRLADQTSSISLTLSTVPKGETVVWSIPVSDLVSDSQDLIHYPVWFDYLSFYLNAATQVVNTNYNLFLKDISLVYNGMETVGVTSPVATGSKFENVQVLVGTDGLTIKTNQSQRKIVYALYSSTGIKIRSGVLKSDNVTLSTQNLAKGIYLVVLSSEGENKVCKINIK